MSVANRVIKNTGFLYAKMGITMFISLYTTRLILDALGVADFGIFSIVGGAIAMLGFLNSAMTGATQRFMSYAEGEGKLEKQKTIFNVSIILHLTIAIILGLCLYIAGYFFFNGVLTIQEDRIYAAKIIYYFMIVSTILTVMTVPYQAVLNAHENMLYFAIIGILESILKLMVAIIVVYTLKDKLIMYGALMALVSLTVMSVMRIYTHRKYSECVFAPRKYFEIGLMKEMTSFAGWNFLSVSSAMISQYGLSIVLNNFWGTLLNAAQGIANQISGQLMTFSKTMMKALSPVITKSEASGQRQMMLNASMSGAKVSFLLLAFFAVPFILEAPFILGVWLKDVPEWAVIFTRLQLLRSLIDQLTLMISGTISAQGDIKKYSIIKSGVSILPVFLTALLFKYGFPPYYLYITWIFCDAIIGGFITVYFSKLKCGLSITSYLSNVFLPCMVISSVMLTFAIIPVLIMPAGFVRFFAVGITSSVTFIFIFWFYFLSIKEKQVLTNLISLIKNQVVSSIVRVKKKIVKK